MWKRNSGFLVVDAWVSVCIVSLIASIVAFCIVSHMHTLERGHIECERQEVNFIDLFTNMPKQEVSY